MEYIGICVQQLLAIGELFKQLVLGGACGKTKLWDKYSDLAIKNIIILFKWIYLYIPALKSVISCELLLFCSLFSMFGECSVFCVFCESADVE